MRLMTEKGAEDLLEKYGFEVVERALVKRKEELGKLKIPFPWVMKINSSKVIHKAKVGGVYLNIKNLKEAEKTFDRLRKIKDFDGALVQQQVSGEEIILGLRNTPEFGSVVMFGKGGGKVEKEKNVSFRVIPLSDKETDNLINEIKGLNKEINLKKVKNSLLRLSKLAMRCKNISELDINPLIVNKKNAIVTDARIIFN